MKKYDTIRMKKYSLYLFIVISCLIQGCYNDKGNYDYRSPEECAPAIVSELKESYEATSLQQFVLEPDVENDGEHMEYLWYIFPTTNANLPNDTIGHERKLDYFVTAQSGNYRLVFKATDTRTGTSAYQESTLTIASAFSSGYYILKYENGHSDIDFVDKNGVLNANLLKQLHGEDMPGKPIRQIYTMNRYCFTETDATGNTTSYTWQPAYIVCTDEDMKIFHGDDLHLIKTWETAFMETPAIKKPQGVWGSGSGGFMMMNNGSLHALQGYLYSDGCFGHAFQTSQYSIPPTLAVGGSSYLAFDENQGTFIGFQNANGTVITNTYAAGLPNVTGYDLVWMGSQPYSSTPSYTYSIIKNRTDDSWMLIEQYTTYMSMVGHYFTNHYTIPSDFGICNGKVFAAQGGNGGAVIYYSTGDNLVHYYNPKNQTERTAVVTLPDGEQIVQLKHIYFAVPTSPINLFLVLARAGEKWKVYTYQLEGSTPDIIQTPVSTYSGQGLPGHLIYRDPNLRMTH